MLEGVVRQLSHDLALAQAPPNASHADSGAGESAKGLPASEGDIAKLHARVNQTASC